MGFRKRMRFALMLTLCALASLLLPAGAPRAEGQTGETPTGAPPAGGWRSVGDLLADWGAYQGTLVELPREERVAVGLAFFEPLAWGTLLEWCGEGHPAAVSEEERRALQGIVDSKLRWRGPRADTLAAMVGDSRILAGCQEPVVKYVSKNRDLFVGTPDGEMLARAFLALADSRARTRGIQFQLERGAICLWDGQELMTRMLAHCRSGDRLRMEQGIAMLGLSLDARAGDSLLAFTRSLAETGAHPQVLEKALITTAKRGQSDAFEMVGDVFRSTPDAAVRRAALLALAWSGDRRAHPILLREYGDSTGGIVDSTHELTEGRSRYWDLWVATRVAEPALIGALREGRLEEALLALELIDRESRYGPPADQTELYPALEAWAAEATAAQRDRVNQIMDRFRAYPDYRAESPGVAEF